jgi:hypothetical protein
MTKLFAPASRCDAELQAEHNVKHRLPLEKAAAARFDAKSLRAAEQDRAPRRAIASPI